MSFNTIHIGAGHNGGKTVSAVYTLLGALATRPNLETALIASGDALPAPCTEVLEGKGVVVVENGGDVGKSQYDVVVDDGYSHLTQASLEPLVKEGGLLITTHQAGDTVDPFAGMCLVQVKSKPSN